MILVAYLNYFPNPKTRFFSLLFLFCVFLLTSSPHIIQAGLELSILPWSSECWHYRCVPPCLVLFFFPLKFHNLILHLGIWSIRVQFCTSMKFEFYVFGGFLGLGELCFVLFCFLNQYTIILMAFIEKMILSLNCLWVSVQNQLYLCSSISRLPDLVYSIFHLFTNTTLSGSL